MRDAACHLQQASRMVFSCNLVPTPNRDECVIPLRLRLTDSIHFFFFFFPFLQSNIPGLSYAGCHLSGTRSARFLLKRKVSVVTRSRPHVLPSDSRLKAERTNVTAIVQARLCSFRALATILQNCSCLWCCYSFLNNR